MKTETVPGAVAAIVVAMVNNTERFDIRNELDREHVRQAIAELLPAYAQAMTAARLSADREMFAD